MEVDRAKDFYISAVIEVMSTSDIAELKRADGDSSINNAILGLKEKYNLDAINIWTYDKLRKACGTKFCKYGIKNPSLRLDPDLKDTWSAIESDSNDGIAPVVIVLAGLSEENVYQAGRKVVGELMPFEQRHPVVYRDVLKKTEPPKPEEAAEITAVSMEKAAA